MEIRNHIYYQLLWDDGVAHLVRMHSLSAALFCVSADQSSFTAALSRAFRLTRPLTVTHTTFDPRVAVYLQERRTAAEKLLCFLLLVNTSSCTFNVRPLPLLLPARVWLLSSYNPHRMFHITQCENPPFAQILFYKSTPPRKRDISYFILVCGCHCKWTPVHMQPPGRRL